MQFLTQKGNSCGLAALYNALLSFNAITYEKAQKSFDDLITNLDVNGEMTKILKESIIYTGLKNSKIGEIANTHFGRLVSTQQLMLPNLESLCSVVYGMKGKEAALVISSNSHALTAYSTVNNELDDVSIIDSLNGLVQTYSIERVYIAISNSGALSFLISKKK
jgi:hypothetical protein